MPRYSKSEFMNIIYKIRKSSRKNNSGTLVGPPCGMVNGDRIMQSLQYGWSRGLMNMPIQKGLEFSVGTEIEVTLRNGLKNIGRALDMSPIGRESAENGTRQCE